MKYAYILMAASIGLLAGCSQMEQDFTDLNRLSDDASLVEKVVFDVLPIKDGDNPETRASAVPTGSGVGFAWEENDMIGIYPNKGSQIYFTIEDGAGSSSATFDGGGWALKQNASYVSYYPFVADFFLSRNEIPVSFAGQKQVGTESPFNGARYFLASASTSSENGVLKFTYNTLNTIINVNATLPAGTYTKASLTIEEPLFVEEGTYSLDDREIIGSKFTNTLEIELEDVILTEEGTIPIYIMSNPVDLKDKEVTVKVISSDGKKYECVKTPSKAYEAGTRYGLTCDKMEIESQSNNVIYYTSSDKMIITPNANSAFGANIVSNEYVEGRGIIQFDGTITTIGESAFSFCDRLTSIEIPETVTAIGNNAFQSCENLFGDLALPSGLTTIGANAFSNCSGLTGELIFPEGLMSIGDGAFSGCNGFWGDLVFPSGLTTIGGWAFEECSGFEGELVLPSKLTSLGPCAFWGCRGLSGSLRIPNGITSISGYTFYECSGFSGELTLPESLVSIEGHAFDGCSGLVGDVILPSGLTTVGEWAFAYCDGFTGRLFLPESLTIIGERAFSWCSGFSGSLILPETLTAVGNYAFDGCSGFSGELVFPTDLKSISEGAFAGCNFAGDLIIPSGLTTIGSYAFKGCCSFSNLTLPSSIKTIGNYAFSGCTGLSFIMVIAENPPSVGKDCLNDTNNCVIYVPTEKVGTYQSANGWSNYADRIQAINNNIIFADEGFKEYCVENFDTNGDGEISSSEAEAVTAIDVNSMEITSLQGIEHFINLNELICYSNQLTSLDLSSNTSLTKIMCQFNQLNGLDVSKCSALTSLECGVNQLSSLDVSNNTALTFLACSSNQLISIDLGNNSALETFYCDKNQLISLDLSNNTALNRVWCYSNPLLTEIWLKTGQTISTFTYDTGVATIKYKN